MKTKLFTLIVLSFVLFVSTACSNLLAQPTSAKDPVLKVSPTVDMGGAESVHYWKGAFPVTTTAPGQPVGVKWTGIPWMVLEQDKVSLKITTVVLGMSESTYELPGGGSLPWTMEELCLPQGSRTPDMDKLEIKGCILIMASSVEVENGVQQFSFKNPTGDVGFVFNYTSDQMEGTASILDGSVPLRVYSTEPNAIKLYRLK